MRAIDVVMGGGKSGMGMGGVPLRVTAIRKSGVPAAAQGQRGEAAASGRTPTKKDMGLQNACHRPGPEDFEDGADMEGEKGDIGGIIADASMGMSETMSANMREWRTRQTDGLAAKGQ